MMRTINIRCNWNDLNEIRARLNASLQKCANRSSWKTLSFIITRYSNSLHISVQATLPLSLKFEKEQQPVVPTLAKECEKHQEKKSSKQAALLQTKKEVSEWTTQTPVTKAENQIEVAASTIQESEKQSPMKSGAAPVMDSDKIHFQSIKVQEQKEAASASREKQKIRRDAATQIDLEVGAKLQKLSDLTTIFFGSHPLITNGTRSVKSIQVGDGNIQQVK